MADSSSLPDPLLTFEEYLESKGWNQILGKLWLVEKPADVFKRGMAMLESYRQEWEEYRIKGFPR